MGHATDPTVCPQSPRTVSHAESQYGSRWRAIEVFLRARLAIPHVARHTESSMLSASRGHYTFASQAIPTTLACDSDQCTHGTPVIGAVAGSPTVMTSWGGMSIVS
jgi:hypothetical protein